MFLKYNLFILEKMCQSGFSKIWIINQKGSWFFVMYYKVRFRALFSENNSSFHFHYFFGASSLLTICQQHNVTKQLDFNKIRRVLKFGKINTNYYQTNILIRYLTSTSFQRQFILKSSNQLNSRSESRCIIWGHMKFFYCPISWGRSMGVENINMKFC